MKVWYPLHPLCGQTLPVVQQDRHGGVRIVVERPVLPPLQGGFDSLRCGSVQTHLRAEVAPADESKYNLPDSQAYVTAVPKMAKPDNIPLSG